MNYIRILMLGMGQMYISQLSFGQDQIVHKPELSGVSLKQHKVDPVEQERVSPNAPGNEVSKFLDYPVSLNTGVFLPLSYLS